VPKFNGNIDDDYDDDDNDDTTYLFNSFTGCEPSSNYM
jgi:hypothetical protein